MDDSAGFYNFGNSIKLAVLAVHYQKLLFLVISVMIHIVKNHDSFSEVVESI